MQYHSYLSSYLGICKFSEPPLHEHYTPRYIFLVALLLPPCHNVIIGHRRAETFSEIEQRWRLVWSNGSSSARARGVRGSESACHHCKHTSPLIMNVERPAQQYVGTVAAKTVFVSALFYLSTWGSNVPNARLKRSHIYATANLFLLQDGGSRASQHSPALNTMVWPSSDTYESIIHYLDASPWLKLRIVWQPAPKNDSTCQHSDVKCTASM